mmetsp:Transcript_114475/g.160693  ORF Transcript_114475/g.160693 Transcript_114475/m.160693 type:complete len:398 (+) Transcript_114475:630-1823(+)
MDAHERVLDLHGRLGILVHPLVNEPGKLGVMAHIHELDILVRVNAVLDKEGQELLGLVVILLSLLCGLVLQNHHLGDGCLLGRSVDDLGVLKLLRELILQVIVSRLGRLSISLGLGGLLARRGPLLVLLASLLAGLLALLLELLLLLGKALALLQILDLLLLHCLICLALDFLKALPLGLDLLALGLELELLLLELSAATLSLLPLLGKGELHESLLFRELLLHLGDLSLLVSTEACLLGSNPLPLGGHVLLLSLVNVVVKLGQLSLVLGQLLLGLPGGTLDLLDLLCLCGGLGGLLCLLLGHPAGLLFGQLLLPAELLASHALELSLALLQLCLNLLKLQVHSKNLVCGLLHVVVVVHEDANQDRLTNVPSEALKMAYLGLVYACHCKILVLLYTP